MRKNGIGELGEHVDHLIITTCVCCSLKGTVHAQEFLCLFSSYIQTLIQTLSGAVLLYKV